MTNRKPLSKRVRFEVFKRDLFVCQYCGKKPPNVILHVDHIQPVSDGGTNRMENLITSCADCNFGKSNVPLARVAPSRKEVLRRIKETEEQVVAYNEMLIAIREREHRDFWLVSEHITAMTGKDPKKYMVYPDLESSIRTFQKWLPVQEIIDAASIASARFNPNLPEFHKYFCGVCWRKIKGDYAVS